MAVQVDTIRAMAERVAASHHLEVVEAEFVGGGKARTLRIYVEKDAAERARLRERIAAGEKIDLPSGVPVELLSGVTHEDCAEFARDFGTLLDVEDAVPGSEYTLEVSSPGLERSLKRAEEYERFAGSLVKVKTFVPVNGSKVWTGRLLGFADGVVKIDPAAAKQKGKARKVAVASEVMEIALRDIEKANLVAEI
ncbi:MAG TPA: ribosome maturation factor RimP [Acidobacteriaceae bacterium]|nr:ribosome maturation factor RimP [Acidobacteriaceae bacterium]